MSKRVATGVARPTQASYARTQHRQEMAGVVPGALLPVFPRARSSRLIRLPMQRSSLRVGRRKTTRHLRRRALACPVRDDRIFRKDWPPPPELTSFGPLTLAVAWLQVKRDLMHNRDPDYDSEEEEAWSYSTLREPDLCVPSDRTREELLISGSLSDTERRATLTMVNPATGVRGPAKNLVEFEEWQRRRANGSEEAVVQVGAGDEDGGGGEYGIGGGDGGSDMGDDE